MTATAPAAPAKVYFTNLRTHARESQLDKLKRLIRHAGIEQIDFENKFVAIKIHFGELGNLSFLRPNYARAVADVVKELGGKPFLTDCNTLYVGLSSYGDDLSACNRCYHKRNSSFFVENLIFCFYYNRLDNAWLIFLIELQCSSGNLLCGQVFPVVRGAGVLIYV